MADLVRRAVERWGFWPSEVELAAYGNNAVFQVQLGLKHLAGVRVYRPGARTKDEIESEWRWVRLLADKGLKQHLLSPIASVYEGTLPGYDGPVHVAGWSWRLGELHDPATATPEQARKIGACAAQMHHAAAEIQRDQPDLTLHRPTLDYEGLFGERSPYNPADGAQYISEAAQETLDAVAERVRNTFDALGTGPSAFGMIHADFIYKNTLFDFKGNVVTLDFDTCGYGYYLYDLAPPLLFYKPQPTYNALKDALWEGYTSVRPLPDGHRAHLETLVAGRYVASCRWVAGHADLPSLRGRAREVIDGRAAELRDYLKTGVL